ncbi:hypothetical protein lbkm_1846 [Lachnospiraceae bacterium KM106-2]|nr:hypothetical protein lbkm_1846 [Lachnospiraceae bacterium KM106-2]
MYLSSELQKGGIFMKLVSNLISLSVSFNISVVAGMQPLA